MSKQKSLSLPKFLKSRMFWSFTIAFILIVGMVYTLMFTLTPQSYAQEYLEEVNQDFLKIKQRLNYYEGAFTPLAESVKKSQQAFYEISSTRGYFESVEDTQQDIEEINTTLALIKETKTKKADLETPIELIELSEQLDTYYLQIEKGLTLLLAHENFQQEMLHASGDELNNNLKELDQILQKEVLKTRLVEIITNISLSAQESVTKFDQIDPIPPIEESSFQLKKTYHQDLSETMTKVIQLLKQSNDPKYTVFLEEMSSFLKRNSLRKQQVETSATAWVENSPIKIIFEQTTLLEESITLEIEQQKKLLEQVLSASPSLEPNASASATPTASASATPTASASAIPSISPTATPSAEPTITPTPEASSSATPS